MSGMNYRFQFAALMVLALVLIDYFRSRKLPLRSNRFFTAMLACTCLNLLFDILTVYTISHQATVPEWVNRLCHQVFIASLDATIFMLYLYVSVLGSCERHTSPKRRILTCLPFLFSLVMVVIGEIEYYNDGVFFYSYGSMASTVYVSAAFYIIMLYMVIFSPKSSFDPRTRRALAIGAGIWVFAALVQRILPVLLISGLAVVLMILYIYLSFENPMEHMDLQTASFSRRAFHLMLSERLSLKRHFRVLHFVMDDMSTINTLAGYASTSSLLSMTAKELENIFELPVYHYRWNSMAVITEKDDYMEKAARVLERFTHHWRHEGRRVYLSCRADVLECPKYAASADEIYGLLDFMYARFSQGGGESIRVIDDSYLERQKRYQAIQNAISAALKNDGFYVLYQPIYCVPKERFASAEALVRMKDAPGIGPVYPDEFIPIAEEMGAIGELGNIVLEKVCRFASENTLWDRGIDFIEVNLSGIQITSGELMEQIFRTLKEYGVKPGFINFEITESVAVASGDMLNENMRRLRDIGSSLSMDDFGTGYSNLSQIAATSYDLVKLDKSLIWPCFGDDPAQPRVILESVVSMINRLGTKMVAEGVETREQADALIDMKVYYLQGYLYSRPISDEAFMGLISCS